MLDTQLWYDSYLAPGENYDENLIKMIDKCDAVLLLVTPHLMELDNYVLRVEIPYAKASGKPIIAILMEETNLKELYAFYGISQVYNLEEWRVFSDILTDAGIKTPKVISYPEHLVNIGMLYRDGKNVEQNIRIACELFYQAAESGYSPAFAKLIEIKTGEYQESYLNYDEAVVLFEEYIRILKTSYEEQRYESTFTSLLDYLRKYGEFCLNQSKLAEAHAHLLSFYEYVKDIDKEGLNKFCTYKSVACLLLGKALNAMREYRSAEIFFRKSMKIDHDLYDDDNFIGNSLIYINCLTSLCELGNFYQQRGELLKAKIAYKELLIMWQNSSTFYGLKSDTYRVHVGYSDEYAAKNAENLSRFALISLMEIESEFQRIGKYHPKIKCYPRNYITDPRILENCDKNNIPLLSHEIMINSLEKIKWLVEYVSALDIDFDLCHNQYCLDAKSIMGVMALDMLNTYELIIHLDNLKRAEEIMREIVNKLND